MDYNETEMEPEMGPVMTREEKLNHLIEVMKKEETFANLDMGQWFQYTKEKKCGYAACALGNAGMDPLFQSMGLVLNREEFSCPDFFVNGEHMSGFKAAQTFFEIDQFASYFLFDPEEYYTSNCYDWLFENVAEHVDKHSPDLQYDDYYFSVCEDYDMDENPDELEITPQMVINHIILVRDHPEFFVR